MFVWIRFWFLFVLLREGEIEVCEVSFCVCVEIFVELKFLKWGGGNWGVVVVVEGERCGVSVVLGVVLDCYLFIYGEEVVLCFGLLFDYEDVVVF